MNKEDLKKIKVLYYPYKLLKRSIQIISDFFKDGNARRTLIAYQKSINNEKDNIRVGFIVQMSNIWDKQKNVYDLMSNHEQIETIMIVVPPFDFTKNVITDYEPNNYFLKEYPEAIKGLTPDGRIINIKDLDLDYIFLQRPYDRYLPVEMRSYNLYKISKVCYIPYGFSMSKDFTSLNTNKAFFRNVYFSFLECDEILEILKSSFRKNIRDKVQKFEKTGFPEFDSYKVSHKNNSDKKTILWTPRWSYDPVLGGSHFFEYKDEILNFAEKNPYLSIIIRPHPLMFENFIKEGKMSKKDVAEYKRKLDEYNIELSIGKSCYEDLSRADILISDFSSIIAPFFMTGNPIIYCENHETNTYHESKMIFDYLYKCTSWASIEKEIKLLIDGCDEKKNKRLESIKHLSDGNASKRIVDLIINDYKENSKCLQ